MEQGNILGQGNICQDTNIWEQGNIGEQGKYFGAVKYLVAQKYYGTGIYQGEREIFMSMSRANRPEQEKYLQVWELYLGEYLESWKIIGNNEMPRIREIFGISEIF